MTAEPQDAQHDAHTYVEQYDGHTIVYDQGPTSWGAYVEDLPVSFSVGDTFAETQRLIREAITLYLDDVREQVTQAQPGSPPGSRQRRTGAP